MNFLFCFSGHLKLGQYYDAKWCKNRPPCSFSPIFYLLDHNLHDMFLIKWQEEPKKCVYIRKMASSGRDGMNFSSATRGHFSKFYLNRLLAFLATWSKRYHTDFWKMEACKRVCFCIIIHHTYDLALIGGEASILYHVGTRLEKQPFTISIKKNFNCHSRNLWSYFIKILKKIS